MSLQVPDRVQLVPLGFEYDRVLEPAVRYKADKVILIEHDEPDEEKPVYYPDLKTHLEQAGIEIEPATANIFDLYSSLGTIAELITAHATDEVFVNLSAGSKISAIGGMIACMVTREAVNVTPFYVKAEEYTPESEDDERPVSFGVKSIAELPTYPIQGPSQNEIVMLQYIKEAGPVSKRVLIQQARKAVERFQRHADEKGIAIEDKPKMGEYRLLDTHVLDPLLQRECVMVNEVGRTKEVAITEEGRNTLRAFKYLIPPDSA